MVLPVDLVLEKVKVLLLEMVQMHQVLVLEREMHHQVTIPQVDQAQVMVKVQLLVTTQMPQEQAVDKAPQLLVEEIILSQAVMELLVVLAVLEMTPDQITILQVETTLQMETLLVIVLLMELLIAPTVNNWVVNSAGKIGMSGSTSINGGSIKTGGTLPLNVVAKIAV
jgi:hypothetical protein